MNKLKKILLVSVLLLLSTLILAYYAVPYFGMSKLVEPAFTESEANIRRHWQAFKEDAAYLRSNFPWEPGAQKDAGPIVNGRIPWSSATNGCSQCELALPDELQKQLSSSNWLNLIGNEITKGIDVTWIHQLAEYDHWDIFAAKEAKIEENGLSSRVSPLYTTLLHWAKIRLLKGVEENSLLAASNDVRHMAKLIYSNYTLTSATASVSILKFESVLRVHLQAINDPRANSLPAFDLALLERFKRVSWASGLLVNQYTPIDVLDEFLTSVEFESFQCLGLTEGIYTRSFLPPVLRRAFFPERDTMISNAIEREKERCRLTTLENAKETYSSEVRYIASVTGFLGPSWARFLIGNTFAMSYPSPFASYHEMTENK